MDQLFEMKTRNADARLCIDNRDESERDDLLVGADPLGG